MCVFIIGRHFALQKELILCFRYTPLDYALMGEHYDVAQYMIEQGALSITGIQDIAALKIQVGNLLTQFVYAHVESLYILCVCVCVCTCTCARRWANIV